MGHADDGGLGHAGMAHGGVLHVDGGNPLAARLDHVLGAVHQLQEAVGIDGGHVTRGEEAFLIDGRAAFALEVAAGDPGAAHAQVSPGLAVPGLGPAVVVHDLEVHAPDAASLLELDLDQFLARQRVVPGQQLADHADGAGLGHAPALHDLGAELVLEALQHGARHGRAADAYALDAQRARVDVGMRIQVLEQHQPHGGHALREGDLLVAHELVDALAVQVRAGQHQPCAGHGRRIGRAPGVGMEHGHDEHHGLARVQAEGVGRQLHQRVQHGGAVRVQHALGVARGARGVAQRGGRALVELGPVEVLALVAHQLVPAVQVGKVQRGHVLARTHADIGGDGLQMRCELFHQRREGHVEEQHPVLGMVGDVFDLLGKQARVDGVQHRAAARDAEVQRQVAPAVPGQRAHAFARLHAQRLQGVGHLAGGAAHAGPVGAVQATVPGFRQARDDLGVRMKARRMLDQRRDHERAVLHQSLQGGHGGVSCRCPEGRGHCTGA